MARAAESAIADDLDEGGSDDTNDFDRKADILPDSLFDKHIPKPGASKTTRKPAAAADDLDDEELDDEDTLDEENEDLDDDLDDEDDDEDGEQDDADDLDDEDDEDDDDLDEEDEDDDEEEDEEEDDQKVGSNLTADEKKAIDADPKLRKMSRLLQRDYTKKTQAISERENVVDQRESRINSFESAIQTPQGMATFLARNLDAHPDVIGAAFESVATGDGGERFLVEVGLHNPELFDKAYQRVQELEDDEDAKKRHVEGRNISSESARVAREKLQLAADRFDRQSAPLIQFAERVAAKAGVHVDDIADVKAAVVAKLKESKKENGSIDLDKADIKAVVRKVKADLDKQYEKVSQRLGRTSAREKQKQLKEKLKKRKPAASDKRRGDLGGATKRTADRKARDESPTNVGDSLFGYLDQRMGTNRRIERPANRRPKRR